LAHDLDFLKADDYTMASKKNTRTRKAEARRREQEKTKLRIGHYELRTLKRSARKQVERERATQVQIIPWNDLPHSTGRGYPRASLLGLPTELRQNILYLSYSMEDLERDTQAVHLTREERNLIWAGTTQSIPLGRMRAPMRKKFDLSPHEGELLTVLNRRTGALSLVSPRVHKELKYVRDRWKSDLDMYLERETKIRLETPDLPVVARGSEWLFAPNIALPQPKALKGQVIETEEKVLKRKVRPSKCWYGTERHLDSDPMCPMARSDPKKWKKMTRKVGGWRGRVHVESTVKAKKVVFDD
jgi:hypothetical protein